MSTAPPEPARRVYGWRSWHDLAREAGLGCAIGIAITLIESGGTDALPPWTTFVRNGILGVSVILSSRLAETLLSWAIEQSRFPTTVRSVLYAVGGFVGYLFGLAIVSGLFGYSEQDLDPYSYHFVYSISAVVVISVAIGFILHHNRKRNARLEASILRLKEHEFAEKELEIARDMQRRLLPPPEVQSDLFHVTARTEAAHLVGGDFYDVLALDDGSMVVVVADVAGKGIAASLVMASCKAVIPFLVAERNPEEVMNRLNAKLHAELAPREFVALTYAQVDGESGVARIVNAGMPDPYVLRGNVAAEVSFQGDRSPLGVRASSRYTQTTVRLDPGDRLLFLSDGLPEAMIGDEPLGYAPIASRIDRFDSVDGFLEDVRSIPGIRFEDDITVVLLERKPRTNDGA